MKNLSILVFLPLIMWLIMTPEVERKSRESINEDSIVTVTIAGVGDLMCHSIQYNYARTDSGTFDFNPFFKEISYYLSSADLTFGNLETVVAGEKIGYSGYPLFNSPDEYLDALKNAGFDLLTTANNHSLDKGEKGLLRTIKELKERDISYNGCFLSQTDRDSVRIFNLSGINVAFLAYTYGTNKIPVPEQKAYLVNLIDQELIALDIRKARSDGAEIVIVHLHFGEEYGRVPDMYQKKITAETAAAGADIIIGGHPHVLQPVEFFKVSGGALDTGFTAYSLGNFFSNQRKRYTEAGVILYITLQKNINSGKIRIDKVGFLPTWVYKGGGTFRILPSGYIEAFEFLTPPDKSKMMQAFDDTREILTKYTSQISIIGVKYEPIKSITVHDK